jgi:hypothetical protein
VTQYERTRIGRRETIGGKRFGVDRQTLDPVDARKLQTAIFLAWLANPIPLFRGVRAYGSKTLDEITGAVGWQSLGSPFCVSADRARRIVENELLSMYCRLGERWPTPCDKRPEPRARWLRFVRWTHGMARLS